MLPRLLLITNRHLMRPSFEAALEAALRAGARLVQLREKDLPDAELLSLAQRAQALCAGWDARLVINSRPDIALQAGAAGVHLPESDRPPFEARAILGEGALCGVSVHSVAAAQGAARNGADYLIFGSVWETTSHPGAAGAGLDMLRAMCRAVPIPVFAVGGVTPGRVALCRDAGAHGIAVISAVWEADDVQQAVRALRW